MGKTMILTEKPSVAKEYAIALGVTGSGKGCIQNDTYVITWCVGHLVAMSYPQKYDERYVKWNLDDLPFLPEKYLYEVIPTVKEQYDVVHKWMNSKEIDTILYCGDSGREGEVIGRLIRSFGGVRSGITEKRVWIDSCTKEEILRGISEAKLLSEYDNLSDAGILRGIEDYSFGINFSRALSCLYGKIFNDAIGSTKWKPIAVGRVMTCVLGMIVEREKQIEDFKETNFYKAIGKFDGICAEWKCDNKSVYSGYDKIFKDSGFLVKADAEKFIAHYNTNPEISAVISVLEIKNSKKNPPLLYNLAELQAECSKKFKISPDETLEVVQELYEKKLTTYPRTDARVLSSAVAKEIKKHITGLETLDFCNSYVLWILSNTEYQNIGNPYVDDSKITDHYAIIPTGNTEQYSSLDEIHQKVFQIIAKRFLAIFYPSAVYMNVKVSFSIETEQFHVSGKQLKELGYLEIFGQEEVEESQSQLLSFIQNHKVGDKIQKRTFSLGNGQTTPPKRYDSGSMVLAMENAGNLIEDATLREQIKGSGIGTSATRAGIIKKLIKNGYILLNKKTQILTPNKEGLVVYDIVKQTLPDFLNPKMTAAWETKLTEVERGNLKRSLCEKEINDYVREKIAEIKNIAITTSAVPSSSKPNVIGKCPCCGKEVQEYSKSYSCSNKECGFALWKNDKFFTLKKKEINEAIAKELLQKGEVLMKGLYSEKKDKTYDATIVMKLDGNKSKFELKF